MEASEKERWQEGALPAPLLLSFSRGHAERPHPRKSDATSLNRIDLMNTPYEMHKTELVHHKLNLVDLSNLISGDGVSPCGPCIYGSIYIYIYIYR